MKHFVFLTIFFLIFFASNAQNFGWARAFGGSVHGYDVGRSIVTDSLGNVYTTGVFEGTVDFDPGPAIQSLTSSGFYDVFILKLDSLGNFVWVKAISGSNYQRVESMVIDGSGNLYLTGSHKDTTDFGTGLVSHKVFAFDEDIFILKLDTLGDLFWVKSLEGIGTDQGTDIVVDEYGDVYIGGFFFQVVDFDPGVGILNFYSIGSSIDAFIAKYNSNGELLWARKLGNNGGDRVYSIDVDSSGNIYAVGSFEGTVDFDPGIATYNIISAGSEDIFIWKLDSLGNFSWANGHGSPFLDRAIAVCLDASGNPIISGTYRDTVDFDPGFGVWNFGSSIATPNMFVQKLDSNGDLKWVKNVSGPDYEVPEAISQDNSGNIFISGGFGSIANFNPSAKPRYMASIGSMDIFLLKLDSLGNFEIVENFGGRHLDALYDFTLDSFGDALFTGGFRDTVDFDPRNSVYNLISTSNYDAFISKITPCAASYGTDTVTACDSLTWIDGVTYYSDNNLACYTLLNSQGCDSLVSLMLTMKYSNYRIDTFTACDSLTWIDGITYYSSNDSAIYVVSKQSGCDSVMRLNLTIYPRLVTDWVVACDSFTWTNGLTYYSNNTTATDSSINVLGCDSITTLNLTLNYSSTFIDTIEACKSYTWIDAITYTSNNNSASFTLQNTESCDSLIYLSLTVSAPDVGTSINGLLIESHAIGLSYQWLDCDNNYLPIDGETNSSFTPLANGNYAVEVDDNGCRDTSACVLFNRIGIEPEKLVEQIYVFPNPTRESFSVDLNGLKEAHVGIWDVHGKLILSQNQLNDRQVYQLMIPAGLYFVEVKTLSIHRVFKLLKE